MNRSDNVKTVLMTGASGMIGSATVQGLLQAGYQVVGIDVKESNVKSERYKHYIADLSNKTVLKNIVQERKIDRIIHLAALAHTSNGQKYSWEDYRHFNVDCAKHVFEVAGEIPVLFISTVDVYGFTKGVVNPASEPKPVSHYAKSKAFAELECKKLSSYTIFRFSPVYTDTIKRDIQKRYYLKYPNLAYLIGKGTEYEVLNINVAVKAMVDWCSEEPAKNIRVIKDLDRMNTFDCIKNERSEGRAKIILQFPKWLMRFVFSALLILTGRNKYTYLLNKAVCPLRTE